MIPGKKRSNSELHYVYRGVERQDVHYGGRGVEGVKDVHQNKSQKRVKVRSILGMFLYSYFKMCQSVSNSAPGGMCDLYIMVR